MLEIISIYAVLFAVAGVAYWIIHKNSEFPGFWKWMKQGMMGKGKNAPAAASAQTTWPSGRDADVVAVLEDLYEEFTAQAKRLEETFELKLAQLEAQFETRVRTLEEAQLDRLSAVTEGSTTTMNLPDDAAVQAPESQVQSRAEPVPVHRMQVGSGETVYLSILDGLYNGLTDSEIAANLAVSESEVLRVRHILQSPGPQGRA